MAHEYTHRAQALGQEPADLVLTNARLVNVLAGRIEDGVSIAVAGSRVVGIGDYQGRETVDLGGQYVYPGLMDAHLHLESCKLTVPQCARAMSRCGTTTVFADPHEVANVSSIEGVSYLLDTAAHNERVSFYFAVPSCVPAIPDPELETFASYLGPTKLKTFFHSPWFAGLGEVMNIPGALAGDPKVLRKLAEFEARGLPIDGHAPLLSGRELNTYIYLGMRSDHESTRAEEAAEKLARGMWVMLREGSSESNLLDLLPIVNEFNSSRVLLASDDLDPIDLMERGHIDHLLRLMVARGVHPIRALQMATINVATYFGKKQLGAIFPGARADLVVAPDLTSFRPSSVLRGGRFVLRDGQEMALGRDARRPLRSTMNARLPELAALALPAVPGARLRCLGVREGQIVTEERLLEPRVLDGLAVADPERDLAKLCVFERHHASGGFGVGFVQGLGLRQGALASSVCHDSHNLIVAGMDDASILRAAQRVMDLRGGQVAVAGEREACLPLPLAGLMSEASFEEVVQQERALLQFCAEVLGTPLKRLPSTLSFLGLPVIPELKVTDKGCVRIRPGAYPERVSPWQ